MNAPRPQNVSLSVHTSESARTLVDRLCSAYAGAYGVETADRKTDAFRKRAEKAMGRNGFELVAGVAEGELIGFAFGYVLAANDQYWWKGLRPQISDEFTTETGSRTFVLAEIEIRRDWQAEGVGRRIHDELLCRRQEERATLAANPAAEATHAIYEAWGWKRVGQVPGASGDYFDVYDLFVLPLRNVFPR